MADSDTDSAFGRFTRLAHAAMAGGRLPEAEAHLRMAIEAAPGIADGHNNLGICLRRSGRLNEAMACYDRALALDPGCAETHINIGNALAAACRFDAAIDSYRKGLALRPDFAIAHYNLGIALWNAGRNDEAAAAFGEACECDPANFDHEVAHAFIVPILAEDAEHTARWRRRHSEMLDRLAASAAVRNPPYGALTSFYLAYHNEDNRPTMERLCRLFRARVPALNYVSPHVRNWSPPAADGRKIRIGFLSEFFRLHSIGKLYQGLISRLDRSRFEVVVIHTAYARPDGFQERMNAVAERTLVLPPGVPAMQEAVAALALDVLFYADTGDSPPAYYLSFSRLAPVQVTSWGHPDTTGVDTMDYFLSCDGMEGEGAEDHYSEKLVRLARLPCYYVPPAVPKGAPLCQRLGLADEATLYGCPQTLYKLHPDFDAVMETILAGDPSGVIVLIEGKHPGHEALLRKRWRGRAPALNGRALFLPRMGLGDYLALLEGLDVLLDPLHFGSGNSMYEAMLSGTPIVTWPGKFARGRIVSAAYRQMGIDDAPIAGDPADYARLALRLGRDPALRQRLRGRLREAAARSLYCDERAAGEFEAFVLAAVAAAPRGRCE